MFSVVMVREPVRCSTFTMLQYFVVLFLCASADTQRGKYEGSKFALLVANRHINSTLEISKSTDVHEQPVQSEQQCMMKSVHFGHEKCVSMNFEKTTSVKSKCFLLTTDKYQGHLVKDDKLTHLSLPRVRSISYTLHNFLKHFLIVCMLYFLKTQVQRTHNLKN